MSGDCCISWSVNQNFWGCFMMLPERNRWRKSCALINLVSWLKLVKLRLNYLRLDPLNILQCSTCNKFIATSDLICFMCPTDSIKSGDGKTAREQNHQTFCEPGTVSWDQPTFEDWEPQRSSPALIVPQSTPAHFIWSCVMSELCQVAPGPIAIFTYAAHQRPLCLTGTINALPHSLPPPRVLLFIGCCRSRTTNQFQSLWQWGLTGPICLPWGQ